MQCILFWRNKPYYPWYVYSISTRTTPFQLFSVLIRTQENIHTYTQIHVPNHFWNLKSAEISFNVTQGYGTRRKDWLSPVLAIRILYACVCDLSFPVSFRTSKADRSFTSVGWHSFTFAWHCFQCSVLEHFPRGRSKTEIFIKDWKLSVSNYGTLCVIYNKRLHIPQPQGTC